jgi:hypothetical protein
VRADRLLFEGGPAAASTVDSSRHSLLDFTAVHTRKDPPFDPDYLAGT